MFEGRAAGRKIAEPQHQKSNKILNNWPFSSSFEEVKALEQALTMHAEKPYEFCRGNLAFFSHPYDLGASQTL